MVNANMRIYAKYVLVAYLLSIASTTFAQGVGEFTAAPGTGRPTCESITNPVTNQSWCRDGNPPYALKVWNGSVWVSIVSTGTVTGSGAPNEVAFWDTSTSITGNVDFTYTPGSLGSFQVGGISATPEFRVSDSLIEVLGTLALEPRGSTVSGMAFFDNTGGTVTFRASAPMINSWACTWPDTSGSQGKVMKWNGPASPCVLTWENPITGGSCPAGEVVSGISATGALTCTSNASGVSGKVQICDTASTSTVNFATAATSNSYPVTLGTQPSVGTPPHVLADYNNPTTAGFGISISDIPGTGNCVDVSWSVGGVTAASASGVNGTGTSPRLARWSGTTSLTDFAGSSCAIAGTFASAMDANGTLTCASPSGTNVSPLRNCTIVVGADNASTALTNADIGPQGNQCFVPLSATIVEVTVAADAGTPSVMPQKNTTGSGVANILSSNLSTASAGGVACSNTGGTTGLDGVTTCSATLSSPALAAGSWIQIASGSTTNAKRMSISVTYQ